jgi:ubiquinone/menaquinone biosynthesis C-methylase UbiE
MMAMNEHAEHQNQQEERSLAEKLLMRAFGRPQGLLGQIGGILLALGKKEFTRWVVGLLNLQAGDEVLDVGFGPGLSIEILTEQVSGGHIAGVDYSQVMLRQATARNRSAIEAGRVDLRYGSVERLPFPDSTFDKALSINSLQIWPDAMAGLREIRRVLKPGGTIALGFTKVARMEADEVVALLVTAGFQDMRQQEHKQGICVLANA